MEIPHFASALSVDADSGRAESQVVEQLQEGLDGATPDLMAVFVSHHHGGAIEDLGPRLRKAVGAKILVGCTGESIIGNTREVEREPALSVWAARLPGTELRPFVTQASAGEDGQPSYSTLPPIEDAEQTSLLLLADPFSFPMDHFLSVLNERWPGVPAVGGMASGGMGPGQNLLLSGDRLESSGCLGLVLEGGIEVCSVVSQGCRPFGKPWVVTACRENLIHKLGGKSVESVLEKSIGALSEEDQQKFRRAPFIGLAIDPAKSSFERGDFLVRNILGVHAKEKALAVADTVRRGMTVQLLLRDAESASEDLTHLVGEQATGALEALPHPRSAGALVFSCNGRGTRMFEQPDHDVNCIRQNLSTELPLAGFFAAGEIGPVGGRNFLHGFTASMVLFRPRREEGSDG